MTDVIDRSPNDSGEIPMPATVDALTEPTAALPRIAAPYTEGQRPPLRLYSTNELPLYVPGGPVTLYAPTQPRPSVPLPPVPPAPPKPSATVNPDVPRPSVPPTPPPPKPSYAGHLPIGDEPPAYVGRHRMPEDEPMPGTWRTALASAVRTGWARVRGAF